MNLIIFEHISYTFILRVNVTKEIDLILYNNLLFYVIFLFQDVSFFVQKKI